MTTLMHIAVRTVMSDKDIEDLQLRNEARLRKAKAAMGEKYILHPSRRLSPKECKRNAYILETHRKLTSF